MRLPARLVCLVVAALCVSNAFAATPSSFAQNYGVGGYDLKGHPTTDPFGGSGIDYPRAIVAMPDGGFVVAGQISFPYLYLNVYAGGNPDAVLVRFSKEGTILWQKTLHLPGAYDGSGYVVYKPTYVAKMATDSQGNIFVAGSNNNEAAAPFVAKFSPDGDLMWQNAIPRVHLVYGDPPQSVDAGTGAAGMQMSLTNDRGALISFGQGRPSGYSIPAIAKFNSDGSLGFYRAFENPDQYAESPHVCQTADGTKYVLAIRYPVSSNQFGPIYGVGIFVVDSATGNLVSQSGWPSLDGANETVNSIIRTADGGLAVLSTRDSGSGVVFRKFNSDASATTIERVIRTAQGYPGFWIGSMSQPSDVGSFSQTSDGGFLIGGHTSELYQEPDHSFEDMALMKLHGDGTLDWVSIVGGSGNEGNANGASSGSVATQLADGTYGFAVSSGTYKTEPYGDGGPGPKPDWWVGKTDANRHLRNFTGTMADLPLDYYVVSGSTPQSPVTLSYYTGLNYSATPLASSAMIASLDLATFTPPNLPTVVIEASSPRILSATAADAYVTRHFAYHILAGYFPANATLTYSATNLPQGFVIDPNTGTISGVPPAGSETTTPIKIGLSVTDGIDIATSTLSLTISDGEPTLTVNDSDQPQAALADTILTFVAHQPGRPAGRALTVEYSTDFDPNNPSPNGLWQHLTNATNGFMPFDSFGNAYVLGTTNYPHVNGVYFRAHSTTPDRNDSNSNVVGPFDLSSNLQRLGKTSLFATHNGPVANIRFGATEETVPSGISVKIQATRTPAVEGTWVDVANGQMTQDTNTPAPNEFYAGFDSYPETTGVFFRAVASASGYADSVSAMNGPYTFINDPAPQVALTIPGVSGSDGQDFDLPVTPSSNSFNVSANANTARQVKKLSLVYDGDVLESFGSQSGTTLYTTSTAGDHIIEAVAVDDLGVIGDARPVHVRVAPAAPAKIFYVTTAGNWSDSSIWIDGNGNHGVPGADDFAVLSDVDVTLTGSVQVRAVSMNGATINYSGSTRPKLTITGFFTIGGGRILTDIDIADGATLLMINDTDLELGGLMTNLGHIKFHGKGGVTGVHTSSGSTARFALNVGPHPDGFFDFVGGIVNGVKSVGNAVGNAVKAVISFTRPAGGRLGSTTPPAPPPNPPPAPEVRTVQVATVQNSGKIIGNDGASLIGNDGAGIVATGAGNAIAKTSSGLVDAHGNAIVAVGAGNIVASGAGNLIGNDGGGLIGNDGAGIVASGAGNVVAQGAGNIIGNGNASIVAVGAGNLIGNAGGTFKPAGLAGGIAPRVNAAATQAFFTQDGGETAMNGIAITDAVELDGGIMSGSGLITGDLANNAGFITPGHSAGVLGVAGSFTQGPSGALLITAAGGESSQFDQVHVGSTANLDGQLRIYTFNKYVPLPDDPFAPLAFNGANGAFTAVSSNAQVTITSNGAVSALPPNSEPPPALQVNAVKSRKTHGSAGTFDVNVGPSGVEPRSGGTAGAYTIVFTLTNPLTDVAGATIDSGAGSIVSAGIGANPQEYVVNLTGVTNAQTLGLSLSNLKDTFDQTNSSVAGTFRVLIGDVNGDGVVNSADATSTRNRSGHTADTTNFRSDINVDGVINSADATAVRSRSGSSLGGNAAPRAPVTGVSIQMAPDEN